MTVQIMASTYNASAFVTKVNNALKAIRTVLETNKTPQFPADVEHTYEDKFLLVQLLSNAAVAAQCL